jgi:hypothetical protein
MWGKGQKEGKKNVAAWECKLANVNLKFGGYWGCGTFDKVDLAK